MAVKQIDITKALAIDGWMSEQELLWLAERAAEHRCIVELGSHLGRSTMAMLDNTDGVLFAIDNWRGPVEAYYSKEEKDRFYSRFCENVKEYIGTKLLPVRCDHAEITQWPQSYTLPPIDMVFLDGRHEYEGVKHDIEVWHKVLGKGGLLCGHDIDFPGVQQAVLELLGEVQVVDGTSIWWTLV